MTKSNTQIVIKLGTEENFLNLIKKKKYIHIYLYIQKPTANILLNGEKVDVPPP